jgi:hypothetical protein
LPRLRYEQRVNLAIAMGAERQLAPPLKSLGDIRNRFGHDPETTLTAGMVDKLFDAFTEHDRDLILNAYAKTKKELPSDLPSEFARLEPKSKFILISVTLKSMLAILTYQAFERKAPGAQGRG